MICNRMIYVLIKLCGCDKEVNVWLLPFLAKNVLEEGAWTQNLDQSRCSSIYFPY